jgi:hypothetical protein
VPLEYQAKADKTVSQGQQEPLVQLVQLVQ